MNTYLWAVMLSRYIFHVQAFHIIYMEPNETTADLSCMCSFCSRSSPHWAWIWQDTSSGCPVFHRKCCSNMVQLGSFESTCIAGRRSYVVFGKLHLDFPSILCKHKQRMLRHVHFPGSIWIVFERLWCCSAKGKLLSKWQQIQMTSLRITWICLD